MRGGAKPKQPTNVMKRDNDWPDASRHKDVNYFDNQEGNYHAELLIEQEVQKKASLSWPELRQTFYVKRLRQQDEDEIPPAQYE